MKVGSLFSGIGGFDLGLERAGMQVIWQSEIEPYCCEVLKRWWSDVPNLGDIFKIKNPPTVDLICGGFPCQPFSVAGKRQGKADDRYLWPQTIRVIRHVKPRWIVLENVTGLASMVEQIGKTKVESKTLQRLQTSDFYKGVFTRQELLLLSVIIADIEKAGYQLPQLKDKTPIIPVIPACALNAPHRRNRIWIIGHNDKYRHEGTQQTVSIREQGSFATGTSRLSQSSDRHAPDTECVGRQARTRERTQHEKQIPKGQDIGNSCAEGDASDTTENGLYNIRIEGWIQEGQSFNREFSRSPDWTRGWPEVATRLCRVDDGLPAWIHQHRVARLKALGNAIVPQIAEEIGKMIMRIDGEINAQCQD